MAVPAEEGDVVIPDAVMSSLSTACKYCSELENKQERPSLVCGNCFSYVHINCLRRASTPGDFACDVFFDFVCEDCSPTNKEIFKRNRFPWVSVIYLTLHHLNIQSYGISNHGYFHYKTHICSFIDRYWQALFGTQIKQKKNWVGTIAGVLSVYNKLFFKSVQEVAKDRPKVRPRNQVSIDRNLFLAKVTEMGYKDLINDENSVCMPLHPEPVPCKKRRVDSDELSGVSSTSFYDQQDSDGRNELADECSDTSSIHSFQPSMMYDSDSHSRSGSELETRKTFERPKKPVSEEMPIRRESLFSTELNSVDNPWEDPLPKSEPDLVEMTQYEEIQLLKKVENLILRVKDPNKKGYLCRLKAKLALRRLKRHKHLPVFDLDKEVKILGGYMSEDPRTVINSERVLDRFQRSYLMDNLSGTIASPNYGTLLLSNIEPTPYRSLYSGATLKPYIRRDGDSAPTWLKLTDELLRRTNKHIKDYEPPPRATIDYSYVRPQHIAAINNLCAQFFWPGIDYLYRQRCHTACVTHKSCHISISEVWFQSEYLLCITLFFINLYLVAF
ncbi:hypothetical protein HF086_013856 [Spodoptera exigua]|uniref:Zinc finger PHD-type domain-containing protein n=1 Tax=Spodoptera exigua TaxID=7107 RepID=A0A922SG71_SPOEX|nr:hypothetical protein HF086_013856 [Spodoptera exigua]